MKTLHLLVPGLFLPQDVMAEACAGLVTPALSTWLTRGQAGTEVCPDGETWLCRAFGLDAQAMAPLMLLADGMQPGADVWLQANPAHLSLQRANMMALSPGEVSIEEAEALLQAINAHMAEAGLQFFAPRPQRWYVRLASVPRMQTVAWHAVAGRDVKHLLPQGPDAPFWHRLFNEIQMVLHEHPVNLAREQRGALAVNSVWFSGAGVLRQPGSNYVLACGQGDWLCACALGAGIPLQEALPAAFPDGDTLALWPELEAALQQGDVLAWQRALMGLEHEWVTPLLDQLKSGKLDRMVLHVPGARPFALSRPMLWKFWRRPRGLSRYALV